MKYFSLLVIAFSIFFSISCSSTRKASSIPSVHFPDSLPSLPVSEIDLPIKFYAPPILAKADLMIPKEFTSDSWPNYAQPSCDFRYKYRFVRSGLSITCVNNKVGVQFTGNYQVAGSRCLCTLDKPVTPWLSGSCGFGNEPMRKVNIGISSQLNFLPVYRIHSATSLDRLQTPEKCYVSLFSSDVTQLIADSIKSSVAGFCSILDETVAEMSFPVLLQQASEKCYHKINLSKYGFFIINPAIIRIGQLNYSKDTFDISVGLSCRPELSSDSNNNMAIPAIPPLTQKENGNGISSIYLDANYDYKFISKLLSDTLRNKVFDMEGRTIVIKDVIMKGAGNHQVEIKVDFAGSNKGSVYLRGTPVLDTALQALTIPDISYSLESHDLILKVAKSLFRNKIRKTIQGKSYLDIGALIKSNLAALNIQLNRQIATNMFSTGKINDIKLIGLLARQNSVQMQVFVNAELSIIGTGLPQ